MSKQFGLAFSAKVSAVLCMIGCAAFLGCNGANEDQLTADVIGDVAVDAESDGEYDEWVKNFEKEMMNSAVPAQNAGQVVAAQGVTGDVPAFKFSSATTGDVPVFKFSSATTGDVPAFNFNAATAATTGDAPAFNFNAAAAATTTDSAPSFDFASFAKKNAEEKAAAKAEAERKAAEEKAAAEAAAKAEAERKAAEEKAAAEAAASAAFAFNSSKLASKSPDSSVNRRIESSYP